MTPFETLIVSGIAVVAAVVLAWRALRLFGRGESPPPLDTDAQDEADRRVREQFRRRRSDDERRARDEAHGRDLYGL